MKNAGIIIIDGEELLDLLKEHFHFPDDYELETVGSASLFNLRDIRSKKIKIKGKSAKFNRELKLGEEVPEYTVIPWPHGRVGFIEL